LDTSVTEHEQCLNCGAARVGAYCHACGQRFVAGRLRIRALSRELFRHASLERGLGATFVGLCTNPGGLIRRYVAGERRRYVSPVAYLFVSAALMLIVLPLYSDVMEAWAETPPDVAATGGSLALSSAQAEHFRELVMRLTQQTTVTGLTMALPFALLLRLLFARSEINIAEAFAFAFYVGGHAYLLHSLFVPFAWLAGASANVYVSSMYVITVWVVVHASAGYFGRPVRSAIKGLLVLFGSYIAWALVIVAAVMLYVRSVY
jgi:hypothetical protein